MNGPTGGAVRAALWVAFASPSAQRLDVATKSAPPFSVKQADGTWTGISIELWRDVAEDLGVEFELHETDLDGMLAGVAAGKYDAGVAAITVQMAQTEMTEAEPALWEAYDRAYFASAGLSGDGLQTAVVARHAERVGGDSAQIWRHVLDDNRDAFHTISDLRPIAVVGHPLNQVQVRVMIQWHDAEVDRMSRRQ